MLFLCFLSGFVFFPGLFYTLCRIFKFRQPEWSQGDVFSVSERLVSALHASLATAAGIIVVTSCSGDVMTDSHWLVNGFVAFGAPYMIHDIYAMYLSHTHNQGVKGHSSQQVQSHSLHIVREFLLREALMVLHHLLLLLLFLPVVLFFRRDLGDFFIGCFFITEFSTPFICLGKILIQLCLDQSRLHKINGVLVLLTFFTCRILVFPFMYWTYAGQLGIPVYRVVFSLPLQCTLGNLLILAPQIYWFLLLLRKAQRLYLRQKTRKQMPDQHGDKDQRPDHHRDKYQRPDHRRDKDQRLYLRQRPENTVDYHRDKDQTTKETNIRD